MIEDLPSELLQEFVLATCDVETLASLAQVSRKLRRWPGQEERWRKLWWERWGTEAVCLTEEEEEAEEEGTADDTSSESASPRSGYSQQPPRKRRRALNLDPDVHQNPILEHAATLAGGWKALFASRDGVHRASSPIVMPSPHEEMAVVEQMIFLAHRVQASSAGSRPSGGKFAPPPALEVVFLCDGSGSVTAQDFFAMKAFADKCVQRGMCLNLSAGLVQFSSESRVEIPLEKPESHASFARKLDATTRMNGGTNIAQALETALHLFCPDAAGTTGKKSDGCGSTQAYYNGREPAARVAVLLTDGRVDNYQARDASSVAARMLAEVPNFSLFAVGVGNDVDRTFLTSTSELYFPLRVSTSDY
eukprot:CAMPEP_0170142722 /NCGR_PEP_ID=MMETSP0033_2-20121228/8111_1 /TAXON_ID=195969 /ORGANISM="Dolichomastix tenuilepis, Strain CCMP3274" /LENGTH=362 /DNA_ID=CAMNT_0010379079 /DNA_START=57 /DNA_END=1145 /DNA_ORIENTATION=-